MEKNKKIKMLVVFGSISDKKVFIPIIKKLKEKNIEYDIRICSAHRSPEMINSILHGNKYKLIFAGAGLAAHLPGVIASKTTVPVIGVPVNTNFKGIDSFLSIVQMPPGIPVLCSGINKNPVSEFILSDYDSVKIIGDMKDKRVKKCIKTLKNFGVKLNGKKPLSINFFNMISQLPKKNAINVPLTKNENVNVNDALIFFDKTANGGYFVGLNRGENAAIFAVSLIDSLKLVDYRKEMNEKIIDADKKIRKL